MSRLRSAVAVTALLGASFAVQQAQAPAPALAAVAPEHAVIVCQSASFYANYDSSSGPSGLIGTLYNGKKVGHTPGKHPVYNGWAATFDFGAGQWGYVLNSCIGGYNSW